MKSIRARTTQVKNEGTRHSARDLISVRMATAFLPLLTEKADNPFF
jgi:hypothetical protein